MYMYLKCTSCTFPFYSVYRTCTSVYLAKSAFKYFCKYQYENGLTDGGTPRYTSPKCLPRTCTYPLSLSPQGTRLPKTENVPTCTNVYLPSQSPCTPPPFLFAEPDLKTRIWKIFLKIFLNLTVSTGTGVTCYTLRMLANRQGYLYAGAFLTL